MKTSSLVLISSLILHTALGLFVPPADAPPAQLAALASRLLAEGKSGDALDVYTAIVDRAGDAGTVDAAVLYQKGTLEAATGQLARARATLSGLLARGEHLPSRLQLASVLLKLGDFDGAAAAAVSAAEAASKAPSSSADLTRATTLKTEIAAARRRSASATAAANAGRWEDCIAHATHVLAVAPQSEVLHAQRAECELAAGDFEAAFADSLRATTPAAQVRAAVIGAFYAGDGTSVPAEALLPLKRCLASDPDNAVCQRAFRALKALGRTLQKAENWAEGGNWKQAIVALQSGSGGGAISDAEATWEKLAGEGKNTGSTGRSASSGSPLPRPVPLISRLRALLCEIYVRDNSRKATDACAAVLAEDPDNPWALMAAGDAELAAEQWADAVRTFERAHQIAHSNETATRLRKAQRLLKQANRKDYYKVLGVARDADERTIKKAYRKATLKAHPDKEGGSAEKMMALNEAYEVLSNPELRARFDNGEDPNDPEQQQQQQHNPFAHFGGGGFGFPQGGQQQFFFRSSNGQQQHVKFPF